MTNTLRLFTALFTSSFILTALPLSQAFAATSYGDLLRDSMASPAFHSTFSGDAKFPITTSTHTRIDDENCFRELPMRPCTYTTTHDSVQAAVGFSGEGGKQAGVYAESGNIQVKVSGFDKLPSPLPSGFSEIDFSTGYKSQYRDEGRTSLIELISMRIGINAAGLENVMAMVNELLKFPTGKVYKLSEQTLENTLKQFESLMPSSGGSMSSDVGFSLIEKIQNSKLSAQEKLGALGHLIDGLIESGFLMEVSGGTASSHTLTLGTGITKEGVQMYKAAIVTFLKTINSNITNAELRFITRQSTQKLYRTINNDLEKATKAKVLITVQEQDGKVQSFDFNLDLQEMGIPITGNSTITFDYSQGYTVTLKENNADIIDMNTIFDGIMSTVEMIFPIGGTSHFEVCPPSGCLRQ